MESSMISGVKLNQYTSEHKVIARAPPYLTRLIIRLSHQKLSTESADGNESKPRGKLGSIASVVLEGKKKRLQL
jgi:hypothetical protein